ncbi:hypothetical protein LZ31DRAFT_562420 [Colletotrichum somersetense]|nr:hypothetical protein LZ31DRAFT_562420 [Colletotrichum somersetense]
MNPSSPEDNSPAAAVLSRMANLEASFKRARQLRKKYNALKRKVEPRVEPDGERPQTDPETKLQLANLGVDLASQEKEVIRTGQRLAIHRMHKGVTSLPEAIYGDTRKRRHTTIITGRWNCRHHLLGTSSIERSDNALLLADQIKRWFDSYCIAIVPVDAAETPIRRWRTDVLCPGIKALQYRRRSNVTDDLDGKELTFVDDKRPVPRFLYFRFIIALVRMKRLGRIGWQEVWARYHGHRPFPSPEKYIRKGVLPANASHFDPSNVDLVNSWIHEYGFDTFLQLKDDEAMEVARRVHMAVDITASRAKKGEGEDDEEDEDPDEDDEDNEYEVPCH